MPLVVGESAQLLCSSDLTVLSIEWIYDDHVITQSATDTVNLVFSEVNDSLHKRQYLCRVTTPYGVIDRNTTITVTCKRSRANNNAC